MENLALKVSHSNGNLLPVWFYRNLEFVLTIVKEFSKKEFNFKNFIEKAGVDGFPGSSEIPSFYDRLLRILTALRYCQAVWDQNVKKEFEEALVELVCSSRWSYLVRITAADMICYMIRASDNDHAVKPIILKNGESEPWNFSYEQLGRILSFFRDREEECDDTEMAIYERLWNEYKERYAKTSA